MAHSSAERRPVFFRALTSLLALLSILLLCGRLYQNEHYKDLTEDYEKYSEEYSLLLADNDALDHKLTQCYNSAYLEQTARRYYGYGRYGEIVYVLDSSNDSQP